jgi:hypothetical protein
MNNIYILELLNNWIYGIHVSRVKSKIKTYNLILIVYKYFIKNAST